MELEQWQIRNVRLHRYQLQPIGRYGNKREILGRPDDKIGLAGAINGISNDYRNYLAAGGLGILIGDGQLNYRREKIMEQFFTR